MAKIHGPRYQDPLPGAKMETCCTCGATRVLVNGKDSGVSWSPWGFGYFWDDKYGKSYTQDPTPYCGNRPYGKKEDKKHGKS